MIIEYYVSLCFAWSNSSSKYAKILKQKFKIDLFKLNQKEKEKRIASKYKICIIFSLNIEMETNNLVYHCWNVS